jgi:hypothetical protein
MRPRVPVLLSIPGAVQKAPVDVLPCIAIRASEMELAILPGGQPAWAGNFLRAVYSGSPRSARVTDFTDAAFGVIPRATRAEVAAAGEAAKSCISFLKILNPDWFGRFLASKRVAGAVPFTSPFPMDAFEGKYTPLPTDSVQAEAFAQQYRSVIEPGNSRISQITLLVAAHCLFDASGVTIPTVNGVRACQFTNGLLGSRSMTPVIR